MYKFSAFLLGSLFPVLVLAGDYYEEFAKEYESKERVKTMQQQPASAQEVIETWSTAWGNFQPGHVPVLNNKGRLLDWVRPDRYTPPPPE